VRRTLKEIGVRTRMEVITNPVDLKRFKPDAKLRREGRELLGLKPAQKVALCVGQIQPRKGVAEFVAAGRANPGITFVWVGGRPFGKLTDAYKGMNELMEEAPKNVHFAGMFALDRMPSLYNAADMLYFPSVQENCALAITEAAACGLPLLLRELGDYHELYGDSFFSAKDTPGFALAVKQAFANKAQMAAMRRKSLAMAKRFDVGVLVEKLVGVYRRLAEEAGPR
jgi:1,2-diacylglycerol-3-alpha-glucose alpha-1,2-galactosyltransferase